MGTPEEGIMLKDVLICNSDIANGVLSLYDQENFFTYFNFVHQAYKNSHLLHYDFSVNRSRTPTFSNGSKNSLPYVGFSKCFIVKYNKG